MTKVMVKVEVEEGTWTWACAMAAQGKMVECERYARPDPACSMMIWSGPVDPFKYRSSILRWRLYVEAPQPITVPAGSFAWAITVALNGKPVRRPGKPYCTIRDDGIRWGGTSTLEDLRATDWEIVE